MILCNAKHDINHPSDTLTPTPPHPPLNPRSSILPLPDPYSSLSQDTQRRSRVLSLIPTRRRSYLRRQTRMCVSGILIVSPVNTHSASTTALSPVSLFTLPEITCSPVQLINIGDSLISVPVSVGSNV